MIEISHLYKNYGKRPCLKDISFTVNKGEILGFLGPNGAGKTTTMSIITGYLSYTKGSVKVDGLEVLDNPTKVKSGVIFTARGILNLCEKKEKTRSIKSCAIKFISTKDPKSE